jgi:tRNA A-37 threonylcarbamoyl transferase component Bud32
MAIKVDVLLEQAVQAGLLHNDLRAARAALPADKRDSPPDVLAELVRRGKLTKFQASYILKGKARALLLGGYILQDLLGQGGMGMVFRARHTMMERTAAVKLLPATLKENTENLQRFLREVKAAAQLEHPNIVQAYDAGTANGRYFLAMEHVQGVTLDKLVKERGPLPVSTAVDFVVQAARGLAYAHQCGIIHRDIKPANLILGPKNRVRILDMGLACIANDHAARKANLTGVETSLGTADFMAPEQAQQLKKADARSDVYSLGCVLHFLLSGEVMFPGSATMARLLAHQQKQPPSLCEGRSDVPLKLDAVFQRMVAKLPADRYATMAEALADLEECMQSVAAKPGKPAPAAKQSGLPARRVGPARRQAREKGGRRRARLLAVGVAAGVLTIGATLLGSAFLRSARGKTENSRLPSEAAPPALAQGRRPEAPPNTPPGPAVAPTSPGRASLVLSYDFRDGQEGGQAFRDSQYQQLNEPNYHFLLFCKNQRDNQEGFNLEAVVDKAVMGPDGKPGVLRFQVREVPSDIAYFGVSLTGGRGSGDFRISHWAPGTIVQGALQELTLSFRYKSTRPWTIRLEPHDKSYRDRLDFGSLPASAEWATFSKRFSECTNVEPFLQCVNASGDQVPKLKLSWCSASSDYSQNDKLLIADVRIERRPAGAKD